MLGVLLAAGIAGYAAKKITSTVNNYVEKNTQNTNLAILLNNQNKNRELNILEKKMAYSDIRKQYKCAACNAPITRGCDNPYGNLVCEYCGSVLTRV